MQPVGQLYAVHKTLYPCDCTFLVISFAVSFPPAVFESAGRLLFRLSDKYLYSVEKLFSQWYQWNNIVLSYNFPVVVISSLS